MFKYAQNYDFLETRLSPPPHRDALSPPLSFRRSSARPHLSSFFFASFSYRFACFVLLQVPGGSPLRVVLLQVSTPLSTPLSPQFSISPMLFRQAASTPLFLLQYTALSTPLSLHRSPRRSLRNSLHRSLHRFLHRSLTRAGREP
jgi:hypothetical protein